MQLDELKGPWQALDRSIAATVSREMLRTARRNRVERAMVRLVALLAGEAAVDAALLVWMGSFLADHVTEPRFLIPGLALHLALIAAMGSAVHQCIAIRRIDYSGPVLAIQRRLEGLRMQRLRATRIAFSAAPLLWVPMLIVGARGLLGVDLYAFAAPWLLANLAFGVAFLLAALWISHRYGDRLQRSPVIGRIVRDLGGHNLNQAADYLRQLDSIDAAGEAE